MAATSHIEVSTMLDPTVGTSANLKLNVSGGVNAQINNPSLDQRHVPDPVTISTTATECSWNVYSTAKLPKSTQVSNKAQLVESASHGQTFRIGSAIFLPQSCSFPKIHKPFTVPKMSLYIDSVEKMDSYLFVTSRQDVTTIPEPEDEPIKKIAAKSGKLDSDPTAEGTEKDGMSISNSSTDTKDSAATKDKPKEEEADSSDDDDSADKIPQPSDDDSSNELSADESWTEGSTDYDSDQKLREFNPRMPPQQRIKTASTSDSSESESENDGAALTDSEDEEDILEGSDKEGAAMSSDEEDRVFTAIFNDRDDPQYDEEDDRSDIDAEDDDFPDFGDWDLNDFNQVGSDSEECSECGDDSGACAMPSKDNTIPIAKDEEAEEAEEPVGTPIAHIHVYDTSTSANGQDEPKRIFHFKRPTGQILASSPPAIHPNKSLLVWPLGDVRILFADYQSNTYFVRKFLPSQFWSIHVSINCHFSDDGKFLHVVALEKSGKPPILPARKSKAKTKGKEEPSKPKKEISRYELIVSTYRMSDSKTTRAPPRLLRRVQNDLGELDVLPNVTWNDNNVHIALTKKTTAYVYRVELQSFSTTTKTRRLKDERMVMRYFTTELPEWAINRELRFIPPDKGTKAGQLIILAEPKKISPYKPITSAKPENSEQASTSNVISAVEPRLEKSLDGNTAPAPNAGEVAVPSTEHKTPPINAVESIRSTTDVQSHEEELPDNPTQGDSDPPSMKPSSTTNETPPSDNTDKPTDILTPSNQNHHRSIHPGTMIAHLSAFDIEFLGGWRNVNEVASAESKVDETKTVEDVLEFVDVGAHEEV